MTDRPSRPAARRRGGFASAGALVQPQIRKVGEGRGFAVSRLMTRWAEVVGPDLARLCQPVKIGYGRGGLGATLTILCSGAAAPLVQAQIGLLRERVNACYGYNAVARVRVTQTAAHGFAEAQARYAAAPQPAGPAAPDPAPRAARAADDLTAGVTDPDLRAALAGLGRRILSTRSP